MRPHGLEDKETPEFYIGKCDDGPRPVDLAECNRAKKRSAASATGPMELLAMRSKLPIGLHPRNGWIHWNNYQTAYECGNNGRGASVISKPAAFPPSFPSPSPPPPIFPLYPYSFRVVGA